MTDVFPAFAPGLGRGDGREMRRPPRAPSKPIVSRSDWLRIAGPGATQAVATPAAFMLALFRFGLAGDQAVTVTLLTLALAQLWNVFNVRVRSLSPNTGSTIQTAADGPEAPTPTSAIRRVRAGRGRWR